MTAAMADRVHRLPDLIWELTAIDIDAPSLGTMRLCGPEKYEARSLDGECLGVFRSLEDAADAVSAHYRKYYDVTQSDH
jgi:hypothetical protein